MAINVTTSKQQIQATVADEKVTANVSAGFGAVGPSGVINVTAPITNAGTTTNANVGIAIGSGLSVSGGSLVVTPDTYATLVDGKIPSGQLPSYVDDVVEVASYGSLPSPGEQGKIYVITGTNKCYRWSGFVYVEIVASPGTTDALTEGNVNLYHTTARAAAAAPVQSVNGQTGAVTVTAGSSAWNDITGKPTFAAVATSGSYADLSNIPGSFTPSSHTHGSITNDGKVGSDPDKVLVTVAAGAVTATSTLTFTHLASTSTYTNFNTSPGDLAAALGGIDSALTGKASEGGNPYFITVNFVGDVLDTVLTAESLSMAYVSLTSASGLTLGAGTKITFPDNSVQTVAWPGSLTYSDVGAAALSHQHSAADVTSGVFDVALLPVGTGSTQVAAGNHTHTQLHDRSHAITSTSDHTAGAWKVIYTDGSGNVQELALGASGKVLQSNGAAAAPTWETATGGDTVSIAASATDILSVSSGSISADDAGSDQIVFWDDSAGKLTYLATGTGLTVSGTTITGNKTLARFTPTHNQPPASAYATLDTRNSILVLEFDSATQESAVFCGVIPENAVFASGLIVRIWWMGDTATSGNVRWGVSFEKTGTDTDSDSFDTVTQAHSAANGTSGIETVTSITATAIDSLAAGDRFRLKVTRIADDATNDTMTGDAQLLAVEVQVA